MTAASVFAGKVLLYVEDDPVQSMETFTRLGLMGFGEILFASDLCQAEALVRDMSIDVAFLDVHLGMSTTLDIAMALAKSGTHVVFTSGYDRDELGDRLGDFPFLKKPFSTGELSIALEDARVDQHGSLAAE